MNNKINLSWLKQQKKTALLHAYKAGIEKREQLRIEKYDDAVISPFSYQTPIKPVGGVFDKTGEPILLSKVHPAIPIGDKKDGYVYSDKSVIYCGGCMYAWGHFLVDVVSRLWYALLEEREADLYVIMVTEGTEGKLGGNFLEFLRLLGIEQKVVFLSKRTKFKQVIIPEKSFDCYKDSRYYTDEYLETFNYVIRKALCEQSEIAERTTAERIFMTRRMEADAGIELIDSFFTNNGFEVLDPAEIPLKELIFKLQMCKSVAYISGTLQHNLMFAPPDLDAIAIERRALLVSHQIGIDLIKRLNVDYIDAHYSIIPDIAYLYGLYGYTKEMKKYIEEKQLNPPDICYCKKEYLECAIKNYMKKYTMAFYREAVKAEWPGYVFADYETSIKDLENDYGIKISICKDGFYDVEKAEQVTQEVLWDLRICYSEWNESSWWRVHDSLSKLVRKVLKRSKPERFLIYPFGKNGMLLKQILQEQYGVKDIVVFDSELSKINKSIKPLDEIKRYCTKNSCCLLTSLKKECWEAIAPYAGLFNIEGPFSVVRMED